MYCRFAGVNEDANAGSSVAAVTVTDSDAGRHGETSVKIIAGNSERNFALESYASGSLNVLRVAEKANFVRYTHMLVLLFECCVV